MTIRRLSICRSLIASAKHPEPMLLEIKLAKLAKKNVGAAKLKTEDFSHGALHASVD